MYKAMSDFDLDAEKHSPASSVQSTKRWVNVCFTYIRNRNHASVPSGNLHYSGLWIECQISWKV